MTEPPGEATDARRWLAGGASQWDTAEVIRVDREHAGSTLRLRLPEIPVFLPGQYFLVRLAVPGPPGAVQQAYSVSSSPFPPSRDVEITVRAVEGGRVSPSLVWHVEAGDLLHVSGPYGSLTWTEADGGPVVLVGGGSGVAPFVSIVRDAATRGLETPMTMLCSSRTRNSLLLRGPLEGLSRDNPWFTLVHTFTRDQADAYASFHRRIDAAMLVEVLTRSDAGVRDSRFYVAGPTDMVTAVRTALVGLGAPEMAVNTENHA